MDAYRPFQDYLGLSALFWKSDLLADLEEIMVPRCDDSLCRNLQDVGNDSFTPFDPLEIIRTDAREDFQNNGTDVDLDDLDRYQSQLRERTTLPGVGSSGTNGISVLDQYLALKEKKGKKKMVCVFCKNNGELAHVYQNHVLKDAEGRTTCPILRKYRCPICGAVGDDAHTVRYCPLNDNAADQRLYTQFNNTCRLSTGRKRRH